MKRLILFATIAFLSMGYAFAQKNAKSAVTFDSYEWDFGNIDAANGAVCHTFTFKNNSKKAVKVGKVIPSCECITVRPLSKSTLTTTSITEDVQPGKSAQIMVVFNPKDSEGKTYRSVELLDTEGNTLGSLTAKANVSKSASEFPAGHKYPYLDTSLSNEERVENLISLLTPQEKVGLMMNKSVSVDRLGIPSYNWWSEACHGVRQGGYTVYPQPIGMAAAFSEKLVYDVFSTVSDEARANWNRSDHNVFNVPMGVTYYPGNPELTFWCPNVNIFRDPRWGRGQETCGEDPYMNAVLGVQTVLGMQGNDDKYFKTHACAKHYAVHSGPEPLRHTYNASVSMRDLWETYLPAFKALVKKANVREVMCAYNRYEDQPCCTSDRLLVDILRRKWNYDAIVLTDCDAINNFYNKGQHETHPGPLEASVDAVLNGTDLECGKVFMVLTEALDKGLINESTLDFHLRKTLLGRFELGMFDPAEMSPWANLTPDVISSESNNELATQAARESMVLLKNNGILPLSKSIKTIAVVGPNADDVELLNGNYGGTPTDNHKHSLLEGIKNAVPGAKVIYHKACTLNDEYNTINHLPEFNDGKGAFVEFWNNKELKGNPDVTGYYNELNFSTFGAWGFAEGINNDSLSVRVSGKYKADFTGDMKYNLNTDNGYILKVNGEVVEEAKGSGRRGFRRGPVEYKSFPVKAGETYDICIEYGKGNGNFAMLRGEICERKLVDFTDIQNDVKQADAIIVIGGISARMEGEGGDKADIELPKVQQRLVRAMHETGKPVVMVNCSGSAIAFGSVEDQYDALLQAWYPGQGGAKALADVIFGDFNPSGKLPVTFYASNNDLPDFLDYSMENRTYRYFRGNPLYAFGYGMSYTSFEVGKAKLSKKKLKSPSNAGTSLPLVGESEGVVTITIPVTNTGSRAGEEIVQVYVKALDYADAPIKSLKGFKKVMVAPGETVKAEITLDGESFEYYDPSIDELSTRPGRYQILYGTSSLDKDLKAVDFVVK
ncbi:MAG: glycoside hydrolase family 3 C-terminal domain-containing protein [Bacteroidaceae bacterium]|nr:glycoside hydrolase family 3 C-terminal domain-containing protein [Bacteroidaceae bacterium]